MPGYTNSPNQNEDRGWYRPRRIPHCSHGDRYQHITYRLADSLPGHLARGYHAIPLDQDDRRRATMEAILDAGHGSCLLQRPECGRVVVENWQHFAGKRYDLVAWVVMPNHCHVLIRVLPGHSLAEIVHSWKSYSAKIINRIASRKGTLWQRDFWDRYARNEDHLARMMAYIHDNPVQAGLCNDSRQWRHSSAWDGTAT